MTINVSIATIPRAIIMSHAPYFESMITRYKVDCSHIVSASDAKIVLRIA
jgi:hypothetical protein